jgi:RND family efflux transporter MFP subunit
MSYFKPALFVLAVCAVFRVNGLAAESGEAVRAVSGDVTSDEISFQALVTPEFQIELASPGEGIVTDIPVKEGVEVEARAPLVLLRSEEEAIRLENARLVAEQLEKDAAALERLFEEKAASRDDLNRARLQARQAAAERDLLAVRLRDRTITSPINGCVLRLFKNPGEAVQRMEKVAEIIALDRKFLVGYLDAELMGSVRPGMVARIARPASGEPAMEGTVEVVDPVLDPGGKVFRIKVLVGDPENTLQVGTRVGVGVIRE